ncbi:hypothetical protein TNCV_4954381 [Trichonephila clavipes]|nr:hypothetical protein TNCV_4954381 [Trichonephila clavipes]
MIPAYNKKKCAAFPFETGIRFRRKTDFFPEENTTMYYSGFEPELTRSVCVSEDLFLKLLQTMTQGQRLDERLGRRAVESKPIPSESSRMAQYIPKCSFQIMEPVAGDSRATTIQDVTAISPYL